MKAALKAFLLVFALLTALVWVSGGFQGGDHSPNGPKSTEDPNDDLRKRRLAVAGVSLQRLRDSMRNPDSFKLRQALIMDNGATCYEFRSQNGFGGMNDGYAALTPTGRLATNEMPGGTALWNQYCANKNGKDETWGVGYVAGLHGIGSAE